MEPTNWAPAHSDALREHRAKGLSFSKTAEAINLKFNTCYSRNATVGRARRLGLAGPDRPEARPPAKPPRMHKLEDIRSAESKSPEFRRPASAFENAGPAKLRCVEIEPRHLSLIELADGDCHYPYGGDEEGEAITFCGHPKRPGSSYCAPHFHLSRNPQAPSDLAAGAISLRIVEMA